MEPDDLLCAPLMATLTTPSNTGEEKEREAWQFPVLTQRAHAGNPPSRQSDTDEREGIGID